MSDGVQRLMADAGCPVRTTARNYRASIALRGFEAKVLKPQGIVEMLHAGGGISVLRGQTGFKNSALISSNCSTRAWIECGSPRRRLRRS